MAPAGKKKSLTTVSSLPHQQAKPKKTRQGNSKRTLLSATSANGKSKRYRGQGK